MTPQQRFDSIVSALGEPFYTDGKRAIYCGDCRSLLPLIEPGSVDLVLTDPPYGMDYDTDSTRFTKGAGNHHRKANRVIGDAEPFDPSPLLRFPRVTCWGANHYASRLPVGTSLVWQKKSPERFGVILSDAEIGWESGGKGVYLFRCLWDGFDREAERGDHFHPTQKPVSLMRWCIERHGDGVALILDPFMGSGTTLRAAKDLDRYAVGIELEPRYCEIAAKRLRQGVLEFDSAEAIA